MISPPQYSVFVWLTFCHHDKLTIGSLICCPGCDITLIFLFLSVFEAAVLSYKPSGGSRKFSFDGLRGADAYFGGRGFHNTFAKIGKNIERTEGGWELKPPQPPPLGAATVQTT